MTMHLARGLTTLNTRKRKKKPLTLKQIAQYEQDMRAHNKRMRQMHCHNLQMNLEEYVAYVRGESKPRKQESRGSYKPTENAPYTRTTEHVPSLDSRVGFAPKKEPMKYTGTLIKGIATMHKSNAVPIRKDSNAAIEIARMRR